MGALFKRAYRIKIGPPGGKGKLFDSDQPDPLQIEFDVTKSVGEEPNTSILRIRNLTEATADEISAVDNAVIIEAGYAEHTGPMLMAVGIVTSADTIIEDGGSITEIEFLDGYLEMRDCAISVAYPKGTKADSALKDIAGSMKLELVMSDKLPFRVMAQGYSFYGPARIALRKICGDSGLAWSIQNGQLQIIKAVGYTPRKAVTLRDDSGLIGSPRRTRIAAREKKYKDENSGGGKGKQPQSKFDQENELKKTKKDYKSDRQKYDGWSIKSLLLPQVVPGDIIKLESSKMSGFMRVDSLRHSGSFYGDEWITELQVREIQTEEGDSKDEKKSKP